LSEVPVVDHRRRLLAIDDNADSANLVCRIAARCGFDARAGSTPATIRETLTNWRPDIVTLDLCMPEVDAIDLLPFLKDAEFKGPVVIISGQESALRRSASKLANAHGIKVVADIEKPVDPGALRGMLLRMFEDR
jgi:two-component system, chemotaxis family, chemotaxis protein CheY